MSGFMSSTIYSFIFVVNCEPSVTPDEFAAEYKSPVIEFQRYSIVHPATTM